MRSGRLARSYRPASGRRELKVLARSSYTGLALKARPAENPKPFVGDFGRPGQPLVTAEQDGWSTGFPSRTTW